MDELVVRVARAIACFARLRMLSRLVQGGEMAPRDLARELGLSPHLVSAHLMRLGSAGLIQRRRSGVWCYCLAESPYSKDALSGKTTLWLRKALVDPALAAKNCGVAEVRNRSRQTVETQVHKIIFDAATAFTNVRRLQILRRLADHGPGDVTALTRELHMSPSAVSRNTAKLVRRGYVTTSQAGQLLTYRLARGSRTPLHAGLFEIVRSTWQR